MRAPIKFLMMLMIASNSLASKKEGGSGGGGGRGKTSKKGRLKRNCDVRRKRSHMSLSVKSVGCEGQEKLWTEVWGSTPQEGQRRLEISLIFPL